MVKSLATLRCPDCGSVRLYRAGLRYLCNGKTIQRWLCRNCGFRFSEPNVKLDISGQIGKGSDSATDHSNRRIASFDLSREKLFNSRSFGRCKNVTSHDVTVIGKGLNKFRIYNSDRQVCAQKDAKNLDATTETKTVAGEKGKLVEYAWKLKKRGLKEKTIEVRTFLLNQLLELGADLNNPDSVETILATEKFTACKKHRLVSAYSSFTKVFKICLACKFIILR